MPFGKWASFEDCVQDIMKTQGKDEETAKKICGKLQAELEESFSWTSDLQILKPYRHLIRGEAIHPIKTLHAQEWPSLRVYLEEELEKSAKSLIGKPLFLDHWRPLHGSVLGAHYEDGAIEYVADLRDEDVLKMIRDGQIQHASVQFEWKSLENVNGVAPRGITFEHLSLLKDMEPGDPMSTVEIWESIARQLKEAKDVRSITTNIVKGLAPSNPQKGSEREVKKMKEILKERVWDREYINDLPDTAFALILGGGEKDESGRTTPRNLRKFPHHRADGSLDLPHLRNANARVPQSDLSEEQKAEAQRHLDRHKKAAGVGEFAEAEREPFKHAWKEHEEVEFEIAPEPTMDELIESIEDIVEGINEALDALVRRVEALEQAQKSPEEREVQDQQEEESERDEHGYIIDKERWDEESQTCVPIPPAELEEANKTIEALKGKIKVLEGQKAALQEELKRKLVGEAIIPSTVTPPSDVLKEIKRLLPERVPSAWGGHYYQLWRNLRNLIKKHESRSQG